MEIFQDVAFVVKDSVQWESSSQTEGDAAWVSADTHRNAANNHFASPVYRCEENEPFRHPLFAANEHSAWRTLRWYISNVFEVARVLAAEKHGACLWKRILIVFNIAVPSPALALMKINLVYDVAASRCRSAAWNVAVRRCRSERSF